jgi:hypothetical protein
MLINNKRIVYAIVTFAVAACTALIMVSILPSASIATPVNFSSVAASVLQAHNGVFLSEPTDPNSSGASQEARSRALAAASSELGGSVRESHYAHCVSSDVNINEDCWAVSVDPTNFEKSLPGPYSPDNESQSASSQAASAPGLSYVIALVDPATGKVLEMTWGS